MDVESYNQNVYNSIRRTIRGNNGEYVHDESEERKMMDELKAYSKACHELYLQSILNPESHLAKIPSRMPVESALGSLKYNFNIKPNSNGYFCLIIDPYYHLGQLYQSENVDGTGSGTVTTINFNQMSGIFVAATTSNVKNQNYTTFLNFDNIENLTNKQVLKCVDGCKLIYSPIDESATEFRSTSKYTDGTDFNRYQYLFVIAGYSFPNTSSIRVDFFRNIEYTVTPTYAEYITQTKDIATEFVVPQLDVDVMPAPVTFNGNSLKNNKSWLLQVKEFASKFFKSALPVVSSSVISGVFGSNFKPFGNFGSFI